ncbi:uncharacterized protein BDR25DRAFT_350237 [Lindgomyces ingoldianus]|uniref:Uncharacterized protein n=1 Tax=Lindgomyces ingoldianus TaxID=673940 RepID=A0ACB6R9T7_9PLEO|nr:uncharacterized protein BDR25DRAFT_350237 [Lindgomyces ingoldianus]KAF2475951.1 hypothetical protein BDR25DRAFT_350237 [Lindgomyces ingoldianus]
MNGLGPHWLGIRLIDTRLSFPVIGLHYSPVSAHFNLNCSSVYMGPFRHGRPARQQAAFDLSITPAFPFSSSTTSSLHSSPSHSFSLPTSPFAPASPLVWLSSETGLTSTFRRFKANRLPKAYGSTRLLRAYFKASIAVPRAGMSQDIDFRKEEPKERSLFGEGTRAAKIQERPRLLAEYRKADRNYRHGKYAQKILYTSINTQDVPLIPEN